MAVIAGSRPAVVPGWGYGTLLFSNDVSYPRYGAISLPVLRITKGIAHCLPASFYQYFLLLFHCFLLA
jgi:hypothetical protein